jgi:hypothetical protein
VVALAVECDAFLDWTRCVGCWNWSCGSGGLGGGCACHADTNVVIEPEATANVTTSPSPEMIPDLVVSKGKTVTSQDGSCGASPQEISLVVETRWSGEGSASADKMSAALAQLKEYFRNSASCGRDLMFARS